MEKSTKLWGLIILLALLVPLIISIPSYIQVTINKVVIYAIIAIGLNILVGYSGQISIGHAAFLAIGAYTSAFVTMQLNLSFVFGLVAAGVVTGIIGGLLGIPALRLKGHYLAIATLGFGVAVSQILIIWKKFSGGYQGKLPPRPDLFGFKITSKLGGYYLALVVLLIVIYAANNLLSGRTGRALKALRDSKEAAQAMGINTAYYKTLAFIFSAVLTGVAGALFGHLIGYISPYDFNLAMSLDFLAMIVVGGLASISGSLYGAAFIVLVPELFNKIKHLPPVLMGVSIIAVILFLPQGLASLHYKIPVWWRQISGQTQKVGSESDEFTENR